MAILQNPVAWPPVNTAASSECNFQAGCTVICTNTGKESLQSAPSAQNIVLPWARTNSSQCNTSYIWTHILHHQSNHPLTHCDATTSGFKKCRYFKTLIVYAFTFITILKTTELHLKLCLNSSILIHIAYYSSTFYQDSNSDCAPLDIEKLKAFMCKWSRNAVELL